MYNVLSVKVDEVVKAESEIRQLLFRQIVTANAESYSEVLKRGRHKDGSRFRYCGLKSPQDEAQKLEDIGPCDKRLEVLGGWPAMAMRSR
jgi:hypothetical protein